MAIRLTVFAYILFAFYSIFKMHNYVVFGLIILSIPVLIFILSLVKKFRISKYKKLIENVKNNPDDENIKPFLNVNRVPYYIIELVPGVKTEFALKIQNRRKSKFKIKSFEEFASFTELPPIYHKVAKKVLKF